jgi:hypothetical protein
MRPALHPPYSPELAPLDFHLFGYVKGCLTSLSFEDIEQLLEPVQVVLEGIEKWPYKRSFSSGWTVCLVPNG